MARVVGVHGIAQELKGPSVLHGEWFPSLKDGVAAAGVGLTEADLVCAFYGGQFRPKGTQRAVSSPAYRAADIEDTFEKDLLALWWEAAAAAEPKRVVSPDAEVRLATPRSVQAGLRALSRSRFFAGLAERALIGSLKQVRLYVRDPEIRSAAQEAVNEKVTPETRVLLAHSLGSVVAYEALHRFGSVPNWANVHTYVTLGSPLAIRNLIFDELNPPPAAGKGQWPPTLESWVNISDDGDVVALQKKLGAFFDGDIVDIEIDNGAEVHDISPYLTAPETGAAIADGLG